MNLSDWTKILIIVTVIAWILWDGFVYYRQGNLPTESWTIKKWAFRMPGIAFIVGGLIGHFFFSFTAPETLCIPDTPTHTVLSCEDKLKKPATQHRKPKPQGVGF